MNAPGISYLQVMQSTSMLSGGNNAFVESLYEDYLRDFSSVPAEWRAYFDKLQTAATGHDVAHSPIQRSFLELGKRQAEKPVNADLARKQSTVLQLINAHRFLGTRVANLDPLNRFDKPVIPELDPAHYGLGEEDMETVFDTGSLVAASTRRCEASGAGEAAQHPLPQTAGRNPHLNPLQEGEEAIALSPSGGKLDRGLAITSDLESVVGSPSRMASSSISNVSRDAAPRMTLREIWQRLRRIYCGSIGVEYMHISEIAQKRWIQSRLEGVNGEAGYPAETKKRILERLTAAEGLERYLHTKYVGQKRFSLEGGETLIPLLHHLLQRAGGQGVKETVIGMAHRGRLNVLVNTLGKLPKMLFAEFDGIHLEHLTSGDVKYHQGFSSDIGTPGGAMHLTLAFNPSHLEIVNPMVEGSVRARQHRRKDLQGNQVLPVLLHGDAAFSGQGVNQETFNLSQTRGYRTGGTVHVVINNQIGFTTSDSRDMRSSLYCTDVAKMVDAPIFHVNADDPEAVLLVTEIALDFRMQFGKDVVIDMVCFRKLGHNEQDEPLVTQPFMYRYINQHPGTRAVYAKRLVEQGVLSANEPDEMIADYRRAMDEGRDPLQSALIAHKHEYGVDWSKYSGEVPWNSPVESAVPLSRLQQLAERLTTLPENFKLHSRVEKIIADRIAMGKGELPLDWGMAENLAYASLLTEGYPVRLSGEDCGRGTFFHRHAVLHDQRRLQFDQGYHVPLQNLAQKQADFIVIDSILSEEAVLGFEYGYATAEPDSLTIWEAQFGDFANGAQVVIDQFIASGEAKWGRLCGLVMLLPHGYEGQGPEHSSARIERYLQLCADYNIQVCVPSNSAQIFHLLRRQMLRSLRKPLIVFTPKSLLRSKDASSPLEDFTHGEFQAVILEVEALEASKVRRIIACSGKVYYDLVKARRERGITDTAIIRLEQLYPFPHEDFTAQINAYPNASEVLWCQEEPGNQGAWHRIQHYLLRHLRAGMKLGYALRPSSASPAAGYLAVHNEQQKAVIDAAFRFELDVISKPGVSHEYHRS